jgi:TolA-binding protein
MMQTGLVRRGLTLAAALVIGLAAAPAWAQMETREAIALRDQIAELRNEVQMLQAQVANSGGSVLGGAPRTVPSSGGGGSDITAQLLVRVDQLDDQVRQLRGRIDELQNQLQRQTDDLGKRIDDLAFQMQNPQAAAAAAAAARQAGAPPPAAYPSAGYPPAAYPSAASPNGGPPAGVLGTLPARPPGAAPAAPRTPELAMQEGTAALARRDYVTAEAAAHEVLNGYRTSPRAYDAIFLLAQAQLGQRQYSQAALSYDDAYNRARRGMHAPDALLGLADSLIGLGDKNSACQALAKLHVEFATPRPDLREPILEAQRRAACR